MPFRSSPTALLALLALLPFGPALAGCGKSRAKDPRLLLREAEALVNDGDFRGALTIGDHLVEIDPNSVSGHALRASCLQELGRGEEALRAQEIAHELEPNSVEIVYDLGLYQLEQSKYQAALKSFERAIELSPEFVEAHTNLGVVHARLGHLDEAVASFEKALELRPGHPTAEEGLRRVREKLAQGG